jgi:hypothetical protein
MKFVLLECVFYYTDTNNLIDQRINKGCIKSNDYLDTKEKLSPELNHGGARSGGTSNDELLSATNAPSEYALMTELKQIGKEIGVTVAHSAIAASVIGGAISLIKNSIDFSSGKISGKEATMNVGNDVCKSAIQGGATGAVGAGIRGLAQKSACESLAKSNVALSIASGLINSGVSIYKFVQGEISGEEAMEEIGQNGMSTISSIYAGAVAGAVFGPIGSIVGSLAGYMIASNIYQTCISIFRQAKLTEIQSQKVIAFCENAIAEMKKQREEFEQLVESELNLRQEKFDEQFRHIDFYFNSGDAAGTVMALTGFVAILGKELKFENFEEFDDFMLTDEPLRI